MERSKTQYEIDRLSLAVQVSKDKGYENLQDFLTMARRTIGLYRKNSELNKVIIREKTRADIQYRMKMDDTLSTDILNRVLEETPSGEEEISYDSAYQELIVIECLSRAVKKYGR